MTSTFTLSALSATGARAGGPFGTRPARRERREVERAITYWKHREMGLRRSPTLMAFDVTEMTTDEWDYRFILTIDAVIENWVPLSYGPKFAELLNLPASPFPDIPMIEQLPQRFVPLFLKGGGDAANNVGMPVRIEGVEQEDGCCELYRAVFIAFGVKPGSLTRLAFGAFNRCVRRHLH